MRISRWGGAAALGLVVGLALAGPAWAQDDDCTTINATITDRPDSGVGGNWAHDTFDREVTICETSAGVYTAEGHDLGTFVTIEDATPPSGAGDPLPAGITGEFEGTWTADFTAAPGWTLTDQLDLNRNDLATSAWLASLFEDFEGGLNDDWSWTYTTCTEEWVNQAAGNEGDITGAECPEPTPDPKPTKPAEPKCVDVNTADAETLTRLMHVDADRAAQILQLRPFDSVADLDRVDGLKAGGPRLAELVKGGDGFLPLCDIAQAGGGGGGDDKPGLPVTGSPVLLIGGVGAGLLGLGGGAYLLARRRGATFTA